MSKKSARKARQRQQPAGMDRTPTTDNAGAKVAGRGSAERNERPPGAAVFDF